MKILVCMDSSIYADEIVSQIVKRAWHEGSQFYLLTVVETTGMWDCDSQLFHQAETILAERVKHLQEKLKGPIRVVGEVMEGASAEMILETARKNNIDLILIGSHGDTGIRKAGLGSVAASVVNDAPCSVEVIKVHLKNQPKDLLAREYIAHY